MTDTTEALAAVQAQAGRVERATTQLGKAREKLRADVLRAVAAGVSQRDAAAAAGVHESYVSRWVKADTGSTLGKRAAARVARATPPRPATVDATPATEPAELLTAVSTKRNTTKRTYRRSVFLDTRGVGQWRDDQWRGYPLGHAPALADALELAYRLEVPRVFLTGPAPTTGRGVTDVEGVREWYTAPVPGWTTERTYLPDSRDCVGVYVHEAGQRVEVLRAVAWTSDEEAGPDDTAAAWTELRAMLAQAWPDAVPLNTPGLTGRDLWARTIGHRTAYPVLSDELRALIQSTSGQGRIELRPALPGSSCEALTEHDGVLMYAALTHNLGVGAPTWHADAGTPAADAGELLWQPGRFRVSVVVPAGWAHVGLLGCKASDGTWTYPEVPGQKFTTWADTAELRLAVKHGWHVTLHEGYTQREGHPLDAWRKTLLTMHDGASSRLTQRMVRALILFTIGAFAARSRMVTRTAPASSPEVPRGVDVRIVGDTAVWEQREQLDAWAMSYQHPEWSAAIWARARVKLLENTDDDGAPTGALTVGLEQVVAFRTDAVYLATDPGWADSTKPGRFRRKLSLSEPVAWPASWAELEAVRT